MNTERFNADERGVSEIVGAILVFALVILLLSIIQSQAVPSQNQEIEVQHSVVVQGDLVVLRHVALDVHAVLDLDLLVLAGDRLRLDD